MNDEAPLVALVEGDDLYVFASKAGSTTNPDWYHNLEAHPEITVEYGTDTFTRVVCARRISRRGTPRCWPRPN